MMKVLKKINWLSCKMSFRLNYNYKKQTKEDNIFFFGYTQATNFKAKIDNSYNFKSLTN